MKYQLWLEKPYESHVQLLDIPLTKSGGIEVGKSSNLYMEASIKKNCVKQLCHGII
jgi:hypothetical protein